MSEWFDDIARIVGSSTPRRQTLKLLGCTLVGAALFSRVPRETHAEEGNTVCCIYPDPTGSACGTFSSSECTRRSGSPTSGGQCCRSQPGFTPRLVCCRSDQQCRPDGFCGTPTAIELLSFTAEAHADGTVTLVWETATEVDNAGFNLYRATTESGPYTKINGALIPAQGDPVAGASYNYVDTPGPGTFRYILTDVDISGEITLRGPIPKDIKIPITPIAR